MTQFAGKVAFITGASSGIGEALARELSRRGAAVALAARRADRLARLAGELPRALAVACDVTKDGDVERAIAEAVRAFGQIDVVIANAGFGVAGAVEHLAVADFQRQFDTNVMGVVRTAKAAIPELKRSRGTLVLTGSVAGYVSGSGMSAYSMSKFSVRALADALWLELAPYGVAVTHIAPGFVRSEIHQVDNKGRHHPDRQMQIPRWIEMPTERAARKIANAIGRRKREEVITFHGKIAVLVQRHCPWVIRTVSRLFSRKMSKQIDKS